MEGAAAAERAPPQRLPARGARAGMGKAMEPEKKIRLTSFSHGAG